MSHFLERWIHFKCHRSAKATTVNAGLIHLLSPSAGFILQPSLQDLEIALKGYILLGGSSL